MRTILPWCFFLALLAPFRLYAAPVPVRSAEGSVHGFLLLRGQNDSLLAQGDLIFHLDRDTIEKRMVFHFKDGSLFDETVTFTQQNVFAMQHYHLVQQGPAFPEDMDANLDRANGKYQIKITDHKDKKEKNLEGKLDFPADLYNGMIPDIVMNLPPGKSETIHYVAFTPDPRMVEFSISPEGKGKVQIGEIQKTAVRHVLKAHLGGIETFFAKLLSQMPPDYYVWTIPDEVTVFVGFQGQLFMGGPVWRIVLTSARWPK